MAENRTRQLAAIMFTDIVGYSAMMNTNEKEGIKKASHYRRILTQQVEKHGGKVIQHYGDGSLTTFSSSVAALNCAQSIQILFREAPQIPLRVGIHLGDIVFDGVNIYGDGVNIASRVESMGVPGAILMTERIAHDLKSHPDLKLSSLGKFQFKNIAHPLEVFALANKDFPIPDKKKIRGKLAPNSTARPLSSYLIFSIIGAIALSLSLLFWGPFSTSQTHTSPEVKERISIAVLPIEDLSRTKENMGICNGLMQEIIARISAVKDFRVLPRRSVLEVMKNDLSIDEIAENLKVKYILEGSLQSSNDQIEIKTFLIDVNTHEVVWNEKFGGDYSQIFDFQSTIAKTVSEKLNATLTTQLKEIITNRPTVDMQAYQEYLKGLEEMNSYYEQLTRDPLERAKAYFMKAIKIDPTFADAYAKVAELFIHFDRFIEVGTIDSTIRYANLALEYNPTLAEAYSLKGRASTSKGLDNAESEFLKAYELNPSSAETNNYLTWHYLLNNQYDKAFRHAQEAFLLNPNNASNYANLAQIYGRCGMQEAANEILNQGLNRFGQENRILQSRKAWITLTFQNDPSDILNNMLKAHNSKKPHRILLPLQIGNYYRRIGEYEKAEVVFDSCFSSNRSELIRNQFFRVSYAATLKRLGKEEKAKKHIEYVLNRRGPFLKTSSSFYLYNTQALAGAHAIQENADSTVYWIEKFKGYGNFDLTINMNDPIYQSVIHEPVVQEFIQKEQARIDQMAANIRKMRIKG